LGVEEATDILTEQGSIKVDCEFCGSQYVFDSVDAAQIFTKPGEQPPASTQVH
jgi:molecular chaperone Hsp33